MFMASNVKFRWGVAEIELKTFLNAFNYIDVVIQILAGDLGRSGSGGNYKKDNVVGKRFHVDFS